MYSSFISHPTMIIIYKHILLYIRVYENYAVVVRFVCVFVCIFIADRVVIVLSRNLFIQRTIKLWYTSFTWILLISNAHRVEYTHTHAHIPIQLLAWISSTECVYKFLLSWCEYGTYIVVCAVHGSPLYSLSHSVTQYNRSYAIWLLIVPQPFLFISLLVRSHSSWAKPIIPFAFIS